MTSGAQIRMQVGGNYMILTETNLFFDPSFNTFSYEKGRVKRQGQIFTFPNKGADDTFAMLSDLSTYLTSTGNGSSLTGITAAQVGADSAGAAAAVTTTSIGAVPNIRTLTFNGSVWTLSTNGVFAVSGGSGGGGLSNIVVNGITGTVTGTGSNMVANVTLTNTDVGAASIASMSAVASTQATVVASLAGVGSTQAIVVAQQATNTTAILTGNYAPTNLPTVSSTVTVSQASGKFVFVNQTNNVTIGLGTDWTTSNVIARCLFVIPNGFSTTWTNGFTTPTTGVGAWSTASTNQVAVLGIYTGTNTTTRLTCISSTP